MQKRRRQDWLRLKRDTTGAVYVEFIAVFMPLLTAFLCLAQAIGMYSAKLVTMHSAVLGARAAVVVLPDDPQYYGDVGVGQASGKRLEDIKKAVHLGLAANQSISLAASKVTVGSGGQKGSKGSFGRDDSVTVYVDSFYRCKLPIAKWAVCGFDSVAILQAKQELRVHGADYEYP